MKEELELDKSVVNLMNIIGDLESLGQANRYTVVGDRNLPGGSHGKFQYRPATWKEYAGRELGDPNAPMTPANQYKVTYLTIKRWKDMGLTPSEIDARWNGATIVNGKYVHNSKEREAKFKNAFNQRVASAQPNTQSGVNGPGTQPALDPLGQAKERVAQREANTAQRRQSFKDVLGPVTGGGLSILDQIGTGVGKVGQETIANVATAGNELIQKLGFKGSQNPALNWGTDVNKYMQGEGTKGSTGFETAGKAAGTVAQYLAPQMAVTKAVNTGLNLASKAPSVANVISKAPRTVQAAKLFTEGALGGVATNLATEGQVGSPTDLSGSNPLLQGAANVALTSTFSGIGRLLTGETSIVNKINKAVSNGNLDEVSKLRNTPQFKSFLIKRGLTTPEAIEAKHLQEVGNIKELLTTSNAAQTAVGAKRLRRLTKNDDAVKTFLHFVEPTVGKTGKPEFNSTYNNIARAKDKIGTDLEKIKKTLDKVPDLVADAKPLIISKFDQAAVNTNLTKSRIKELRKFLENQIDSQLDGGGNFSDIDKLRINANKGTGPFASLDEAERTVIGDSMREFYNSINYSPEVNKVLKKFSETNTAYSGLLDAEDIARYMKSVPSDKVGGYLTNLFGATIATGGSFNPFLFVPGAMATEALTGIMNKGKVMKNMESTVSKVGANMKVDTELDELLSKIKTTPKTSPKSSPKTSKETLRDMLLRGMK